MNDKKKTGYAWQQLNDQLSKRASRAIMRIQYIIKQPRQQQKLLELKKAQNRRDRKSDQKITTNRTLLFEEVIPGSLNFPYHHIFYHI